MAMREQTIRPAPMDRGSIPRKVHDRTERLLLVNHLTIAFPTRDGVVKGVEDLTLAVGSHERVGVVGESGSGKSVMGLAILGLVQPPGRIVSGEILWKGENMLDPKVQARVRGREIAMIFQDPMVSLNPLKTVGAQLREVLIKRAGLSRARANVRAAELLELVGISQPKDRLKQYPYELSGGMRQRVMISTALAGDPALLIADEPTTGLDVTIQDQILKLLKELSEELGVSILMITHDLGVVAEFCDRVQVMYGGRIVERSPIDACFAAPSHPYTRGLLASVPRVDSTVETLVGIPGEPLDRARHPRGCAFWPRCSEAMDRCREETPELLRTHIDRHWVACWKRQAEEEQMASS
jgi:peptide/nickel transport system ATP-binding protein